MYALISRKIKTQRKFSESSVHIEQLQVEGGFLHGLDLKFASDLSVLIGGRGVGKTAVIEIIRFCLGAPNFDSGLMQASFDHAAGVLGDGVAKLTIKIDGNLHSITRAASDRRGALPSNLSVLPLIFSQREIETLGRTSRGRLNLIDSFLPQFPEETQLARSRIKSLSTEIRELCEELDEAQEQLGSRKAIETDLNNLKATQAALGSLTAERATKLSELEVAQREVNKLTLFEHSLFEAREGIERWLSSLPSNPVARADIGVWPVGIDPLAEIRISLAKDVETIQDLVLHARKYKNYIEEEIRKLVQQKAPIEDRLRKIRQALEEEQAGSGRIAREVSRLEEAAARFKSLEQAASRKRDRLTVAQAERMHLLEELGEHRQGVFEKRKAVAIKLNKALQPRVKIDVRHSVDVSSYEAALIESLRGSNLRYNEIAPTLARSISPAELCNIVYEKNAKGLAEILKISEDRASRLVSALRESRFDTVLLAPIGDQVEFYLLDGATYKHIDELSIGQRCTVVLSVVLENINVGLIIDQPEDHLDNEFVADTLIKAIRNRELMAQTIVSTHNANIPVLGDASMVIQLDSNGQRGFVKNSGSLKSPMVISAILAIMEGGTEAFDKRAEFYGAAM
ncbi:AAA family ATPase [Xanthomonas arboricola]|uniref:AAA family ATPase n=1 Tax=Xanthomonas arboricola TaxID=56448 RepID=UPI0011B01AB7|nr:AAA family ATPase [Xanthomonas arboricola]